MGDDRYGIDSVAKLREIIGEPSPLTATKVAGVLDEFAQAFIARSPFLLMATTDAAGKMDVSPKGDAPGFVAVQDETTLLIPDRKGNKLVFGFENLLQNPQIGLIFLVPGTGETLRVNGTADLTCDPAILQRLAARGAPAVLATRVRVHESFFHCAKAFLRSQLWKPESWGEKHRVSFGQMMQRRFSAPQELAQQIDDVIEADYRDL